MKKKKIATIYDDKKMLDLSLIVLISPISTRPYIRAPSLLKNKIGCKTSHNV